MKWDDVKMSRLYTEGLGINNTQTHGNEQGSSYSHPPKDAGTPEVPGLPPTVPGEQEEVKKTKQRAGWVEKLDKQNLDKSIVAIAGFGTHELGAVKRDLAAKFEDFARRIKNDEPIYVMKRLTERYGVAMHALKALVEIEKEIEKLRRAGKMPGMLRRYNFSA